MYDLIRSPKKQLLTAHIFKVPLKRPFKRSCEPCIFLHAWCIQIHNDDDEEIKPRQVAEPLRENLKMKTHAAAEPVDDISEYKTLQTIKDTKREDYHRTKPWQYFQEATSILGRTTPVCHLFSAMPLAPPFFFFRQAHLQTHFASPSPSPHHQRYNTTTADWSLVFLWRGGACL